MLVWGRDKRQGRGVRHRISPTALNIEAQAVSDAAQAVGAAQLVVTTTSAKKPILRAEWLHKGLHITAMGSDQAGKNEIDAGAVALVDLYVCDRVSQAAALGELRAARSAGLMNGTTPPELGQIVAGLHPGRSLESAITLCDLTGTGAQDTAIASHAYAAAQKAGIGTMIKS